MHGFEKSQGRVNKKDKSTSFLPSQRQIQYWLLIKLCISKHKISYIYKTSLYSITKIIHRNENVLIFSVKKKIEPNFSFNSF